MRFITILCAAACLACGAPLHAQGAAASDQSILLRQQFHGEAGLTYRTVDGWTGTLDLYVPKAAGLHPLLIYFHGGGWEHGSREMIVANVIPYLEMGFAVANVDYRLTKTALAPAAVEDARCAVRWLAAHAARYRLDTADVVLAGGSAGAHLALMAGMLRSSDGLDGPCASEPEPRIAAIINYYGIADVADLLDGPHRRHWAVEWIGDRPDARELAKRVSPLTYVRPGLPPIITIHGDSDRVVPYEQSARLHAALDRAGVPNELVTVPGGKHSNAGFSDAEGIHAHRAIEAFLRAHGAWHPARAGDDAASP
ncbi:MAG TPA: alpha/beta hydrolase [Gemmatimonadaceae bacterium]